MNWNKLLPVALSIISIQAFSQKPEIPDSLRQRVFAVRCHAGFIFAHSIHVQNTKGTKPAGFEFEYSRLRTDSSAHAHFNCFPRAGLSLTYVDFNKTLLGRSYSLAYFVEPNYRLGNRLRMSVRASAGFSYLTNPFDPIKNPDNQTYSLPVNIFLELDLGFSYPLTRHISFYAMGNFFHNSNGGFKLPNSGLNYINASAGLQYYMHSNYLPIYKKAKDSSWKKQPLHVDVSMYYSPKGGYKADSAAQRKFVAGVSVQAVKQVGNINALTAGVEIYYDDALHSIKKVWLEDESSSTLAGVLLGHQFLLNRFTFSQQLGIYVYKHTDYYNHVYAYLFHTIYHRWGISYNLKQHWAVGINLLAHNQIADFIDGRLIYRLK